MVSILAEFLVALELRFVSQRAAGLQIRKEQLQPSERESLRHWRPHHSIGTEHDGFTYGLAAWWRYGAEW